MIIPLAIYAAWTLLCAFIDYLRIKKKWGVVGNIGHKLSIWLGVVGVCLIAGAYNILHLSPNSIWLLLLFYAILTIGCSGVRLLMYDITLNLMRGLSPFYQSTKSSSETEQFENKKGIGFWPQRGFGALGIFISLAINHWWL